MAIDKREWIYDGKAYTPVCECDEGVEWEFGNDVTQVCSDRVDDLSLPIGYEMEDRCPDCGYWPWIIVDKQ